MSDVDISDTFGAGYIGGMVAAIMYGITTLQTYLYYVYYHKDTKIVKYLVALIWILDTLHISLMCHSLYYYLVSNFGGENALTTAVWSLTASLGLNLCIAVIVQTYFTFRISYLTRSRIRWWLTSAIMVMVIAHFGFGLETAVLMFEKKDFSSLQEITLYAAIPFAITAVLSDVSITIALCVLLHDNRSPVVDPVVETNVLVNTLIVFAINRCLLTSIVAVAEVMVFSISPRSLWFIAIDFVIGKLYANSFLASLNSRSALRGRSLRSHRRATSIRINAALSGLGTSSEEANGSAVTQSKSSNAPRSAHVKLTPDDDLGQLEMGNLDRAD